MKFIHTLATVSIAVLAMASCQKANTPAEITNEDIAKQDNVITEETISAEARGYSHNRGFVYTASNQTAGNMIMLYRRAGNGQLTYRASYATGGNGSGGGLGNQGGVILTNNKEVLLAVNAGSNSISSFKITSNGLNLKSTVSSGGTTPVSIAQYGNLVYVLNAGGTGNISGFRLQSNNTLAALANSSRPLSSSMSGGAQVSFVRNGRVLVITEKATNKIITYTVNPDGSTGMMHSITSASPTPFGFAPGRFGNIYVSEAVGGAANASNVSSYRVSINGSITLSEGPVSTAQSAACWVVLTDNGKNIYTTNTASNTLSSYMVQQYSGNINLQQSIAATSGMGPIDAALSDNSKYLYVLNGGSHSISGFAVANDGSLTALQDTNGLPVGANGLAAD